jgi:hypothetical protein
MTESWRSWNTADTFELLAAENVPERIIVDTTLARQRHAADLNLTSRY